MKHPAKFSSAVLEKIEEIFEDNRRPRRVIDPFAGTGRVHELNVEYSIGVELEPEWASMHPRTIVGNALRLPFADRSFDGMVVSPCYGNRLADHHNAQDGSRRHSYTHDIGRRLHADNAGTLQWGDAYCEFHDKAWTECLRVLQLGALIVVNVSNHIRKGKEQYVAEWHMNWFMEHGCAVEEIEVADTPRLRDGANSQARSKYEYVFALTYVAPVFTPEEESLDEIDECELPSLRAGMADRLDT